MDFASCTHNGMTADNRIHVRIQTGTKDELKVAARLEGLKPSTYIHSLIVKAIGEAKKRSPEAFIQNAKITRGDAGYTSKSGRDKAKKRTGPKRRNGTTDE